MLKFTKTGILYLTTVIVFFLIQMFSSQYKIQTEINQDIMKEQQKSNFIEAESTISQNQEKNEIWKIEIPKISLIADIKDGTTKEVLNQYVGHFEETQKENGNIGLAGHNRGYEVNYFQNLKLLKEGDTIIYTHNEFIKEYEVEKNRIIKDTDWKYLENTEDNRLTLITCVENEPEYRRCIQAIEKEEEIDWKKSLK